MGICSDIMHDFVVKEIKHIYSNYDGWKITPRRLGSGYDTIVVLERRKGGHRECIKVFVTFKKELPSGILEELTKAEPSSDGTPCRHESAVLMPANAVTSAVPEGTKIFTMKSFAFDGNELTWVKKPVRKSVEAKVKASV